MDASKRGDISAYKGFFLRHSARVRDLVSSVLCCAKNANADLDCVNAITARTFLIGWKEIQRQSSRHYAPKWLYLIAARESYRFAKPKQTLVTRFVSLAISCGFNAAWPSLIKRCSLKNATSENTPDRLTYYLHALPPLPRFVFILKQLENFSDDDVHKALNIGLPSISNAFQYSTLFLEQYYVGESDGDGNAPRLASLPTPVAPPPNELWKSIEESLGKTEVKPPRIYLSSPFFIYLMVFSFIGLGTFFLATKRDEPIPLQTFSDYYALDVIEKEYEIKKEVLLSQYDLSLDELQQWSDQINALKESRIIILEALQNDPDNLFLIDMLERSYLKQLEIIDQIHQANFDSR